MIKTYYSIYDKKSKFYSTPFQQVNDAVAIRQFTNLLADQSLEPSKNPEDYQLFTIGKFDDESGELTSMAPLEVVEGA